MHEFGEPEPWGPSGGSLEVRCCLEDGCSAYRSNQRRPQKYAETTAHDYFTFTVTTIAFTISSEYVNVNELHTALGDIAACAFAVDATITNSWTAFGSNQTFGMDIEYGTDVANIALYPGAEAAVITSTHRISNAQEYPSDPPILVDDVIPMLVDWTETRETYRGNLRTVAVSEEESEHWDGMVYSENIYPYSELSPQEFESVVITVTEIGRKSFYHVLDSIDFEIGGEKDTATTEDDGPPDPGSSPAFQ